MYIVLSSCTHMRLCYQPVCTSVEASCVTTTFLTIARYENPRNEDRDSRRLPPSPGFTVSKFFMATMELARTFLLLSLS